jgi:hypothetical protein
MWQEASVRIEGIIKESDYLRSQYLHLRPRPIFAIIGLILSALFLWALISSPSWAISAVVAYLVLWLLVFIPWQAKKNYRQYKALSEPVSVEVQDEGLFFKRENGEGLVPWSHIIKWRQSNTLLLLYPASNVFHLVPSHFFSTPENFSAFKEILREHIGNAT